MKFTTTYRHAYRSAALAIFLLLMAFAVESRAVTIPWSYVGNPGNAADTATGFGSVSYTYNIGTYDVTASQYVEFLNAKDPTGDNTLGLYSNGNFYGGGISYSPGNANGTKYSVYPGRENHPVNDVTWCDAIRFANWLGNGQGNANTENGSYTLGPLGAGGFPINVNSITRNAGATIVVPSENEWYKAAYFNPATSSYFQYPTSSNTAPTARLPTATPNSANFLGVVSNVTDVGAYTGTKSPYGLFDMGGNVLQWNEALVGGMYRGLRGCSYSTFFSSAMLSSSWTYGSPTMGEDNYVGFRVALVPEPSSMVLAAFGMAGLLSWAWLRRKAT